MVTKTYIEERNARMARERKGKNDPDTREEKQLKSTKSNRSSEDEDSEEESPLPPRKPKQGSRVTPSTSAIKQKSRSTSSSSRSGSSHSGPTDSDDEGVSLAESEESHRRTPSKSPSKRRRSASTSQQIAEHKQKVMAKSAQVKKLERENDKMQAAIQEAQAERDDAIAERDEALEDLKKMRRMKDDLRARLHDAHANGGKKSPKKLNGAMVMQTKKVTKKEAWRVCKMIPNDKHLKKVCDLVIDHLKIQDYLHLDGETDVRREEVEDRRTEWISMYAPVVRAALNEQKSYVQSEMKKIFLECKKKKMDLPPYPEFEDIAFRNLNSDADVPEGQDPQIDPAKVEIFDVYLLMLSACAGSHTYGDKQRRTTPVSVCLTKNGKTAVPCSTEAMCLIMYDNCYNKWMEMHKWKEVDNNPADIPKYSSKRHEETKKWMGKYSDSCSGNSPYAGWSLEGIQKFKQVMTEIKTLREDDLEAILEIEQAAVDRFAVQYQEDRKRKNAANGKPDDDDNDGADDDSSKRRRENPAEAVEFEIEMDED